MKTEFYYSKEVDVKNEGLISNLISQLTPKSDDCSRRASFSLDHIRKQLSAFLDDSGELVLRVDNKSGFDMARALDLYPGMEIENYTPTPANVGGHTHMYKINMYPIPNEGKTTSVKRGKDYCDFGFKIGCSPDYRASILPLRTPKDNLIIAIQSLRFGWDFFVRPLEALMGRPELVIAPNRCEIPSDIVDQLIEPESSMDDRVEVLRTYRGNKWMLLVDDDPSLRQSYSERFVWEGYEVAEAGNGEDGITLATEILPDVIIADRDMPHMNGYEMVRRLKADERTGHIPIIGHGSFSREEQGVLDYFADKTPEGQIRLFEILETLN